MIRIPHPIKFEWDKGNNDKFWFKHQVSNSEAEEVFFDRRKKLARDIIHFTDSENRFILLGKTRLDRSLFVVFTIIGKNVRVISARDVNKKERSLYE